MSKKIPLPLDDDDDDLTRKIDATAKREGIPSLAVAPTSGPKRPIKIEVGDELFEALTVTAARQKVTKRYLILSALRDAGYPVNDADLREDGRRLRGGRLA